jgi:biopolymer transport protein ExbD
MPGILGRSVGSPVRVHPSTNSLNSFIMPLKTDTLEEPMLNLTPMIDVVFLLIIFFMVGARFTEETHDQQFDVELPTASAVQAMSREPDPLIITVYRTGRILINNRELDLAQLVQELKAAKEAYADQTVLIKGDGEGQYQSIVDVMNACHQVQIKKFSLAFQPLDTRPSGAP